jgi:hypothetical protein
MSEHTANDKRVEVVKERLQGDLVDGDGRPPEPDEVERVVRERLTPSPRRRCRSSFPS